MFLDRTHIYLYSASFSIKLQIVTGSKMGKPFLCMESGKIFS